MSQSETDRTRLICVAPDTLPVMHQALCDAVVRGGGTLASIDEAEALVWADPGRADMFPAIAAAGTSVEWIQLPYAGIETFGDYLFDGPEWTCGKGVYATPVAEHALAMMLAGRRDLHKFIPATTWGDRTGENLLGTTITILGGGGIAEEFLKLIEPFGCQTNVVRRSPEPVSGATRTVTPARLHELLPRTDVLLIAWALTDETRHAVNAEVFAALPDHAWIINVGRGQHIDQAALVTALQTGAIGGAGIDVTDPEPLPDDSPLWQIPNCIITPHVGNTAEMGLPLLAKRVTENTRAFVAGAPLIGTVDIAAGY